MIELEKDCTIELINELGNNVKRISYDTETEMWTIEYKNDLTPDTIGEDNILNYLRGY